MSRDDRPTIIVDLDGVLYPWVHHMAHNVLRANMTPYSESDLLGLSRSRDVASDWGIPEGWFNLIWEDSIKRGEMYRAMAPTAAGVEAMWKLSDAEWHIHIVTSRLNKFRLHEIVVENTVAWLREYGIPYRSLSFAENKEDIRADAILDDWGKNLVSHPAPDKFLYPTQQNELESGPWIRLRDDDPFVDLVERLT